MGPDTHHSLVARSLREAIARAEDGERDYFVTLEVRGNDSLWVQLTWDAINAAYPRQQEPLDYLRSIGLRLPGSVTLLSWEAGRFVTFEHAAEPFDEIVEFVEAFFRRSLGIEPTELTLQVTTE